MQISHGSKAAQLTAVLDADGGGRQQTSVLEKTPVTMPEPGMLIAETDVG